MTVHHINAGTMCPLGAKYFSGDPGLGRGLITCHCFVIETPEGLVLVDTGMGTDDMRHPYRRLGVPFTAGFAVKADLEDTAIARIRALGLDPADVRHIVATHLDLDHAGGLPDFPEAEVHVTGAEHAVAVAPSLRDRTRYPACHFDHGPRWQIHETGRGGDSWFGFESIRVLPSTDPEVLLIPLFGHSAGHTGVAVRDGEGWLFHCGDAYFNRAEMQIPPKPPKGIAGFQRIMAADNAARVNNQQRLRELVHDHSGEVRVVCAHDHVELEREQSA